MEWNGAFYNAAMRVSKNLNYGSSFLSDKTNLWERTGVTSQRFASMYLDQTNDRIWFIDPQEQFMRIRYFDINDQEVYSYYTCPYPMWYTLDECILRHKEQIKDLLIHFILI